MEITIQREYNTLIWKNQNQEYTYTAKGIEKPPTSLSSLGT